MIRKVFFLVAILLCGGILFLRSACAQDVEIGVDASGGGNYNVDMEGISDNLNIPAINLPANSITPFDPGFVSGEMPNVGVTMPNIGTMDTPASQPVVDFTTPTVQTIDLGIDQESLKDYTTCNPENLRAVQYYQETKQPLPEVLQQAIKEEREDLIGQLGHEDWKVRQEAQDKLIDLGTSVIPDVTKALKSDDPEVQTRAEVIVQEIDRQARISFYMQEQKDFIQKLDVERAGKGLTSWVIEGDNRLTRPEKDELLQIMHNK